MANTVHYVRAGTPVRPSHFHDKTRAPLEDKGGIAPSALTCVAHVFPWHILTCPLFSSPMSCRSFLSVPTTTPRSSTRLPAAPAMHFSTVFAQGHTSSGTHLFCHSLWRSLPPHCPPFPLYPAEVAGHAGHGCAMGQTELAVCFCLMAFFLISATLWHGHLGSGYDTKFCPLRLNFPCLLFYCRRWWLLGTSVILSRKHGFNFEL